MIVKRFHVRCFDEHSHHKCQQQSRRRNPLGPHAANAVSLRNLVKAVVVVAAVLGSETADVLVTPTLITRGTKACMSANYGHSSRELAADSQRRRND